MNEDAARIFEKNATRRRERRETTGRSEDQKNF